MSMLRPLLTSFLLTTFLVLTCQVLPTNLGAKEKGLTTLPPFQGQLLKTKNYTDQLGSQQLILSRHGLYQTKANVDEILSHDDLYAYNYLLSSGAEPKILWQLHDFVHNCETSLSLEFAKSSPIVTDLDHNGLAEVWLTYYLACRGDVSPEGMKIIMYENGQKYALRGETFLHVDGQDLGGKYQLDSAFKKAPEVFRRFADQLWQKQKRHISE